MFDCLYFMFCTLVGLFICLVIGASYVPPWKLLGRPITVGKALTIFFIVIMSLVWGVALYTNEDLRTWFLKLMERGPSPPG